MTTLTLTIGGSNFLPQYKTGSIQITAQIQNQGDTLQLTIIQKTGQSAPAIGQEIILKDGSRTLFGGFITKLSPKEFGIGQMIEWDIEANDYTYLLVNKSSQQSYTNQTLYAIVTDLMTNNVDAGYGFTTTGVTNPGPTIPTINFNHISMRQCLENLAKQTGYIWWIGYDKVLHFQDPALIAGAPETLTDSSNNHEAGLTITTDISQVKNDIVVLGGIEESLPYTQVILGDGQAREWLLLYPVKTMTSIEVDTGGGYVAKLFGVDPADDDAGHDFMYSPDRGAIRATGTTTTPTTSTKIRVVFTYPFPVVTEVRSAPSIIAMKAIEGGDGIHKYTINDSTIVTQNQAIQMALQELAQFANPVLQGRFQTRTGLLQAGSYWTPGTALTVNLPSWGIATDTVYVILKVITTIDESGSALEYHYDVRFGGRLLGVIDFLQALATPQSPLDLSGEVQTIQSLAEVVTIAEVITRDGNVKSIAEALTIAESITSTIVTPPFHWTSTAPIGVWNEAEWS